MHMAYDASKLGKVLEPRANLAGGAAAVALVAALGGTLLAALGATHALNSATFPSIIDIVRAILVR
jgi:ABC-type antimicrobial peptide transport system permease subunit